MNWKDTLRKAPFGRFKRNKKPSMGLNELEKMENVKSHMQEIHNAYSNDANFQKAGVFQIKATQEQRAGASGRKSDNNPLIWLMDEGYFGDIQFIAQHGIPVLKTLGYDVEKVGGNYPTALIEVKKKS